MNALNKLLKPSEWLALATTALVDLAKGYPHKEIGAATGQGLDQLITELVTVQRAQGIDDDGAWDCDATEGIAVGHGTNVPLAIDDFLNLVKGSDAFYVGDSPLLMEVSVAPASGDPDNQVLFANWESEGLVFSVTVTEEGLRNVVYDPVQQAYLMLDSEGDELAIKMFSLAKIEPMIQ